MPLTTATNDIATTLNKHNVSMMMIVKDLASHDYPISRAPVRNLVTKEIWPRESTAKKLQESLKRLLKGKATPEELAKMLKDAPNSNKTNVLVHQNVLNALDRNAIAQTDLVPVLKASGVGMSISSLNQLLRHGKWPKRLDHDRVKHVISEYLTPYINAKELAKLWDAEIEVIQTPAMRKPKTTNNNTYLVEFDNLEPEMLSNQAMRHFKLSQNPFQNDVQCMDDLYMGDQQYVVRESMLQAALNGGILAIIGDCGAGKSELRKGFMQHLNNGQHDIRVIEPYVINKKKLTDAMILDAVADELGLPIKRNGMEARSRQVNKALKESAKAGFRHVLVIEEAHDLTDEAIKYLKRIWELSDGFRNMIGIILIGQPELNNKLAATNYNVREFSRRCSMLTLNPLGHSLTDYIAHKFKRRGVDYQKVITPDGIKALHKRLQGSVSYGVNQPKQSQDMSYPLIVNNFLVNAMNLAEETKTPLITDEVIAELK